MQIVKGIVIGIYFIVCLALVILAMVQSKDDEGLSATITGTSANNFFEKNKGNTKEGKQKKWTVILGTLHCVRSYIFNIIMRLKSSVRLFFFC